MKLTRASSYALHAVAYMAQQQSDKPVASHHIAYARGIPERFLLKVLKPLVTAQVLTSTKGPNGGYSLARSADEISVLEILEAVDGAIRGSAPRFQVKDPEVSDEQKGVIEKANTPLNAKLDQICGQSAEVIKKHLERVRISDLLSGKREEPAAAPERAHEREATPTAKNAPKRKPARARTAT